MTRDQERAKYAYGCLDQMANAPKDEQREYRSAVEGLGAQLLRGGLAATFAWLQRAARSSSAVRTLLGHLGRAQIPGLVLQERDNEGAPEVLARQVRAMSLEAYILATRELLRVILWFKRATQATLGG